MTPLGQTPSQTLGPFFHQGLAREGCGFQGSESRLELRDVASNLLVTSDTIGQRVRIEGYVYDGLSKPLPDALIELWQADSEGTYQTRRGHAVWGFGRAPTDETGLYFFETIKPGSVPSASGARQAPHLNLIVGARGMARHAFTRLYFEADPSLDADPALARVPAPRRPTLIAKCTGENPEGSEPQRVITYRFDIHLQGDAETVFFAF